MGGHWLAIHKQLDGIEIEGIPALKCQKNCQPGIGWVQHLLFEGKHALGVTGDLGAQALELFIKPGRWYCGSGQQCKNNGSDGHYPSMCYPAPLCLLCAEHKPPALAASVTHENFCNRSAESVTLGNRQERYPDHQMKNASSAVRN